jgi:mannosyl-3-phosphoglycerate phosphatase family protein
MNLDPMIVAFTGLDGFFTTSKSSRPIIDAASRLAKDDVPLILCGSHTQAEIDEVQRDIGISHPYISENGSALHIPACYFDQGHDDLEHPFGHRVIEFAPPYVEVVLALHLIARRLAIDIISFSDLSAEEIANYSGTTLHRAQLAKRRHYDEPFRLANDGESDRMRLLFGLRRVGLRWISGESFHHVNGAREAYRGLEVLRSLYERQYHSSVLTIGLGAALSDLALLKHVDLPIIVRTTRHSSTAEVLQREIPHATVMQRADADGWSRAFCDLSCRVQDIRQSLG